jgi:hypothetical protein
VSARALRGLFLANTTGKRCRACGRRHDVAVGRGRDGRCLPLLFPPDMPSTARHRLLPAIAGAGVIVWDDLTGEYVER